MKKIILIDICIINSLLGLAIGDGHMYSEQQCDVWDEMSRSFKFESTTS